MILEFVKEQLRPASPLTLFLVWTVGVAWLWRRPESRAPRRYLLAVVALFFVLTTPIGAELLVAGLGHGFGRIESAADARGATTIVVLGGGGTTVSVGGAVAGAPAIGSMLRALEGARVFRLIGARLIVVSGGIPNPDRQLVPESAMLRAAIVGAGVPAAAVVEESRSRTTREQANFLAPILAARGARRFVLVTSPPHMRRSMSVFRAAGLDPIPSVAPIRSDNLRRPPWLLPNDDSVTLSDMALYEYAAWAYYWWRGWTAPAQ
jgi:uncharacterized SAM-binding protein YcdF (DUF218 family)